MNSLETERKILVSVKNKIAETQNDPKYICGNSDYAILFDFDDEWAGYDVKTARFKYKGTFQDQVFSGNECQVPVISNTSYFEVGVYSGDLHTTTPAYVSARKSILCGSSVPEKPRDDVYAQIMEKINSLTADVSPEQIEQAVNDYMASHPIDGVTTEELEQAVTDALTQAKESGQFDGADGKDGAQGPSGSDGKDGISVTHSWNGTTLTVTSASGTSSADLKGDKGETGATGAQGPSGADYVLTDADKQEIAGMVSVTGGSGAYPVIAMTDASAELEPNTFYQWGEMASLSITLAEPTDTTVTNEYCFEFVSGDTETTLTVPDTIRWAYEPKIEAGKTYQVSILNQIGVIVGA